MSIPRLPAAAAAALVGVLGSAPSASAHPAMHPSAAAAYDLTTGRLWSLVAALLGVAGIISGGLALARPASGTRSARRAIVALGAGAAGAVLGGLVAATADGGPGSGSGIVGGVVALVVGLSAVVLGGFAVSRTRRST